MYFPIGDIHGQYNLMKKLYDKIVEEIENGIDPVWGGTIVFLGDYIDRGPDSKKVLDFLMNLEDTENIKHIILKGNHETFMVECQRQPHNFINVDIWMNNGGEETIEAFDVNTKDIQNGALKEYVEWLDNLPFIYTTWDYIFVHAGYNGNVPLHLQAEEYCVWDFNKTPNLYRYMHKIVIHGHMMRHDGPIIDLKNNRIWMDVGAGLVNKHATVCLPEIYEGETDLKVITVQE